MIGTAAALLLWINGRIAGVSGILSGVFTQRGAERSWRVLWVASLLLGGALMAALGLHSGFEPRQGFPVWALVSGGLLVGFGTRVGSGCTSGHGVCGIARLSWRSIAATVTFMSAGAVTVFVTRHLGGL